MESPDFAQLMLRIWLGIVIIAHGVNHGRTLGGTTNWFQSLGWQRARMQATLSSVAEIGIGLALIAGFLTPIAAAGLVATMFVAYLTVHRPNGFFIFRPGEGYEYVATIAVAALTLAVIGAGNVSLDNAMGIDNLTGWPGLAIGLGGLVVGALQVAMFWRPTKVDAA